ncbi:MAG: 3-hydroxybutyryl-CoA dehydrogenase [Deltaproteobacteria bacterium]|nr:3-hydroxybutyryl-CoA dehydrogenase [Deltaproteobacteria bacterium]
MVQIKTVGVVGAGQMGAGIAQVAAQSGLSVVVTDVADAAVERGKGAIKDSLARLVKKGTLTEADAAAAMGRLTFGTSLALHAQADLVVEAVSESEALKKRIFAELDAVVRPEAILASNTSSISITRLASSTKRADRFIGMHFMNPVPVMKLVELIRGMATSDATWAATRGLAEKMGKTTTVSKDYPGFLANRILMPMINEAFTALMEGVGSAEDIDTTMKLGCAHPMGPLTLADFIGLDTCLAIMEVLSDGFADPRYRPCPLLRQYVDAGWLGKKSGRGVYNYSEAK